MMKSYLRYEPGRSFGVIASVQSNVVYDWSGNVLLSASGDNVSLWNVRQGSLISSLTNESPSYPHSLTGEVQFIARSPDKVSVAVGYSTGEICIFQYLKSSTKSATLRGHSTGISSMAYNSDGTLLASGGRDSDIVIWDTTSLVGQCRLRGHKDAVTGVAFLPQNAYGGGAGLARVQSLLVSVSKDTLLKVWDLSTQHCIQTIVGHRCEIWSLAMSSVNEQQLTDVETASQLENSSSKGKKRKSPEDTDSKITALHQQLSYPLIFTGAADDLLRAYSLVKREVGQSTVSDSVDVLEYAGCIQLTAEKVTHLELNSSGTMMAALCGQKTIEVFNFRNLAESRKKMKRRHKRLREKSSQASNGDENNAIVDSEISGETDRLQQDSSETGPSSPSGIILSDCVDPLGTVRCSHKVRSFSISPHTKRGSSGTGSEDFLALSMINNSIEIHSVTQESSAESSITKRSVIEMQGHRSDVRCVSLSTDGLQIATCSSDGVRIWSSVSFQCIRRCSTGYGVAVVFAPGNRFVLVGTREGRLQVVDCSSGDMTADIEAHDGALWSMAVHPDGKGVMTGGADKLVKFWEFGVKNSTLTLTNWREVQMTHDVLCVRFSPTKSVEKSLIAIGLLDATIKVFFNNSLKFFLSLYGHKLSVMCIDISHDCNILISGSADKTIKIWGLDFGDCHRSLLGHEDTVTAIKFQPSTHYFFSASKDGCVKYWDADRFEQVLNLPGHFSCVWSLDIPFDGSFCVSASQDRSLRIWKRTEDLVFIEEERDRALEAQVDTSATRDSHSNIVEFSSAPVAAIQTIESLKSGEKLLEAIELVENEIMDQLEEGGGNKIRSSNPLLLGMEPLGFLLYSLKNIKTSELEQALLVLPFHAVVRLIRLMAQLCERGTDVELVAKCILFLFRAHQPRIMTTQILAVEISNIALLLRRNLAACRQLVGMNLAALRYSIRNSEESKSSKLAYVDNILNIEKKPKNGSSSL